MLCYATLCYASPAPRAPWAGSGAAPRGAWARCTCKHARRGAATRHSAEVRRRAVLGAPPREQRLLVPALLGRRVHGAAGEEHRGDPLRALLLLLVPRVVPATDASTCNRRKRMQATRQHSDVTPAGRGCDRRHTHRRAAATTSRAAGGRCAIAAFSSSACKGGGRGHVRLRRGSFSVAAFSQRL